MKGRVAGEYCWAMAQETGLSCCGWSGFIVLDFGFQLVCRVHAGRVDRISLCQPELPEKNWFLHRSGACSGLREVRHIGKVYLCFYIVCVCVCVSACLPACLPACVCSHIGLIYISVEVNFGSSNWTAALTALQSAGRLYLSQTSDMMQNCGHGTC